jgi:hypothetical protein
LQAVFLPKIVPPDEGPSFPSVFPSFSRSAIAFARRLPRHGGVFSVADGDVVGLKNAINAANSSGEDDTIELALSGTYELDSIDNDANGLPVIGADGGRKLIIKAMDCTSAKQGSRNTGHQ